MKKILAAVFAQVLWVGFLIAQPVVGSKAPEISLPDVNGKSISLTSLKGKVVLLDFWASWCGPCRINNKKTLPIYKKYQDKGFEVFGVSIDDNTGSWKKAMQQDKTNWKHVIDTKAANGNDLSKTWNLQYIPSTFLLDKEGKIVASGVDGEELEKLLKQML